MKCFQKQYLSRLQDRRGSIMVFAMWVLVFLSMFNVALYGMVRSHMEITGRVRERILCPYIAKSAYYHARVERENDYTPGYDTLYELGTERTAVLGKGKYSYVMADEESKININTSSWEVLSRLPGLDQELASHIVSSKMRPFRAKEELLFVEGVTEEVLEELKDSITVAGKGWVNINTASDGTLAALGMNESLIRIIQGYRGDADGDEVREDSPVFENIENIIRDLNSSKGLFKEQEELLLQLVSQGALNVSGSAFSLMVRTEILNKPTRDYTIVMEDGKIIKWSEL